MLRPVSSWSTDCLVVGAGGELIVRATSRWEKVQEEPGAGYRRSEGERLVVRLCHNITSHDLQQKQQDVLEKSNIHVNVSLTFWGYLVTCRLSYTKFVANKKYKLVFFNNPTSKQNKIKTMKLWTCQRLHFLNPRGTILFLMNGILSRTAAMWTYHVILKSVKLIHSLSLSNVSCLSLVILSRPCK